MILAKQDSAVKKVVTSAKVSYISKPKHGTEKLKSKLKGNKTYRYSMSYKCKKGEKLILLNCFHCSMKLGLTCATILNSLTF